MNNDTPDNTAIDALRNELGSKIDAQTHQLVIEQQSQTETLGHKLTLISNVLVAGVVIIIGSLIVLIPMVYRKIELFIE